MQPEKTQKRTYKTPGSGRRVITGVLLFVSCLLVLAGLLRDDSGGLRVAVKVTPTPTAMGTAFDETVVSREITIPARSWYAIQLGAFDSEESAKSLAQNYTDRGAAGYVRKDGRFRVLAALYKTRDEAASVRQQLQSQHGIDSYVYEITLPEIVLNVSGMAGQLDALEAGMQYLNTVLERFCDISVSMDRRDLVTEEELTALAEVASQAETLQNVIAMRFSTVQYAAVDDLKSLLETVKTAADNVAAASKNGTVAMAAQMKYQTFFMLSGIEGYINGFGQ